MLVLGAAPAVGDRVAAVGRQPPRQGEQLLAGLAAPEGVSCCMGVLALVADRRQPDADIRNAPPARLICTPTATTAQSPAFRSTLW
jgi:hypothetical protein